MNVPSTLRSFLTRLVSAWLFVATAVLLPGQSTGISGIVTDPAGASVPGAQVKISEPNTGFERQAETNGSGFFVLQELNPGMYQLRIEKQGFQTVVRQRIVVEVGRNLQVDVAMKVGDVRDSVTIEETAGIAKTAASTTVVDRQFVENLPLNGRTFQALIAITPGVISAPASFETQGQFSVNGERTNANYFIVDGVSANFASSSAARLGQTAGGTLPALSAAGSTASLVSIESMQEFQIQTSAYAAEYGRQPGAQVQVATRSGSNQYHGTGFEYLRNDALDANDWFANRNRLGRPPLRQNDFGGVIGGPIKRNRLFFFASEESLRLKQPRTAIVAVPNADTRSRVPDQLKPFVNAIAVPNGADLGNGLAQFAATYSDPTNLDTVSGKIDYIVNDRVNLFGRFNYARSGSGTRQTAGFAPNTNQIDSNNLATYTLGSTQALTPRLVNDLRLNYSWNAASTREEVDSFGGAVPVAESALYPSFTNRNESAFFLQMITGVGFVDGNISHNRQRQWNLVDSIQYVHGRNQWKAGVDFRWLLPSIFTRDFDIAYRFANPAGLMSGIAQTASVRAFPVVDFRYSNFSAYLQDTLQASSRLTLTFGLRWEVNPAPSGRNGFQLYPVLGTYPNFTFGSGTQDLYSTTYGNVAPRLGLVAQVCRTPGRELVARAGFGVFYDLGAGELGSVTDNLYTRAQSFANAIFPLASSVLQKLPFPANPPYTISSGVDPKLRLPYSMHYNIALEQQLGANQNVSLGFVRTTGDRLLQTLFYLNPNPNFQQLRFIQNTGESSYNSLQARYQRRLSSGVQTLVSYTWSHSIDNVSGDDTVFPPPVVVDKSIDRGSSDFDVRHVFAGGFTWQPSYKGNSALGAWLRNWSIDSITRWQSALPVNVYETRVFPGLSGSIRTRPDVVTGTPLYLDSPNYAGGQALNAAAFRRVMQAREGTLGRNVLRGANLAQVDLALRRTFAITERVQIEIRSDVYNIANHPNFANPVADVTNPLFGQAQTMYGAGLGVGGINAGLNPLYQVGGPRSWQFAGKVHF